MSKSISIITAVFNGAKELPQMLESYKAQRNDKIELIIVDGGSKDDTLRIIKENEEYIDGWISEKDKGIYDAWNKGVAMSKGQWIMFLGCDDRLVPGALQTYLDVLNNPDQHLKTDVISARVQMVDINNKPVRVKGWPFEWPLFIREMTIAHPGSLHNRRLFEKYGSFNIDYKIVGDYEFLLRAGGDLSTLYIDKVMVVMKEGGASDSVGALKEHYRAVIQTAKYSPYKASLNFANVYIKFKARKLSRRLGLNMYMKKA